MADELNIPLTVTDNTAGAFKSAATNLRNITDVARRNNMSVEEWQKKGSQQQLALSDREVKELKRNVQEHEKAQEKKTHASKRHADAHVHHASLSRAASEQVVEVLAETAAKYLSVAAAIEGAREAFMGFAREDATLRRMSVTFNKTLHEVEALSPAWRATGQAVGASLNEMIDGIDALGKASNKGLDVGSKAIEAMAKGGKALGLTTREAGEIQGAFMRNMSVSGDEAIEVWRQLSAASDAYKLDIKALAPMLPALTVDAERLGYKGTGGVAQVVAMLGKLQATGDAGGGLSRVYRELTSPRIGQMLGREEKRWALELDDVKARGGDVFSYVMGLWQKEKEQNKALTVERMFGERNAKFINALMKDSTKGADDLLRSMKEIYVAGKSGVILDAKLTTVTTGAQASVKRMSDEFEHMSTSFGQLLAVAGAPSFLEGAAKRFESIARMIEYISKKVEGGGHDADHSSHPPPLFKWDPKAERGPLTKNFRNKMIRGGLGLDLFNAATATARIPGDAYKGKYQSHPADSSALTEEDAFRANQALDQEGRDALGLSAYGLGATGAARAGRFKRTREAAKLSVPDFIPGGLRKKIGGEGEVPLAVPVEKIILPIASLDNNIERLTKEVAALKSVLETPRETSAVKFRSRVGGTAPWEERAYQRRIDSHVPSEAGPTHGTATGELLGALGGGSSGGVGSVRGGPSMGGDSVSAAPGTPTKGDPRGMIPYIRETAKKYGIDPDIAVRVAKSEGLSNPVGDRGMSHGAFQLYKGGGLGNDFQKSTGLDAADPANERATIDYALQNASKKGWGAFHGAKRVGIGNREGIGGVGGIAASSPGARQSPSGQDPNAFIFHHTGGRGSPANVVADWRKNRPGIGTQYIMDRDGNIHDTRAEFGYGGAGHMIRGSGAGAGLSNRNTVGMEVVAKNDKDVTPQQVEAARAFMRKNYPNTSVLGHGQVNPGHREASEGKTIVDAIRNERKAGEEQGPQQPEAMRGAAPGLEQYKKMREELEKPIPISFKHDRSVQFARASAAREHDREMRETRHNVNADIGAAVLLLSIFLPYWFSSFFV